MDSIGFLKSGLLNGPGRIDPKVDSGKVQKPKDSEQGVEFREVLQQQLERPELRFSQHAKARLESRGIELTPEDIVRMQEAITKAQEKGSRESLILTDKAAFVVSVKNNTVITAVDKNSLRENVFTNIDSTVMI